jgi:hypothetical protein
LILLSYNHCAILNLKLLVLLVIDSEYNHAPGTQPIPGGSGIYLVSPRALLRGRAARPHPIPPPCLGGGGEKRKKTFFSAVDVLFAEGFGVLGGSTYLIAGHSR